MGPAPLTVRQIQKAELAVLCKKCGAQLTVHAPFSQGLPAPAGQIAFPADNKLNCPTCGTQHDLAQARKQLEQQVGRTVVA